jgi:uncharacterized OsmC-like protein
MINCSRHFVAVTCLIHHLRAASSSPVRHAEYPEPHDLLAAALGACTALTVAMYARRKGMDLQDIHVRLEHDQQDDVYVLKRHIYYVGKLSAEEQNRLTEIVNKYPVHETLSGPIKSSLTPNDNDKPQRRRQGIGSGHHPAHQRPGG